MSCVKTWHLWRCDECGKERKLEHGKWAEARLPRGWRDALGRGLNACSLRCEQAIDSKQNDGRGYIWVD